MTLDLQIANIVLGYLSTDAAIAGVDATDTEPAIPALPATSVLPRVNVYVNTPKAFPCLVIAAASEAKGRDTVEVHVVTALHYQLPAESASNPRETHAATMAAVKLWLRSKARLYAYLNTLADAASPLVQGYDLGRSPVTGVVLPEQIDKTDNTSLIALSTRFFVQLSPTV